MRLSFGLLPFAVLLTVAIGGAGAQAPQAAPPPQTSALKRAQAAGIDVGTIVETVRHCVGRERGERNLSANDLRYRLDLSRTGFSLRLRAPARSPSTRGRRALRRDRRARSRQRAAPFDRSPAFAVGTSRIREPGGEIELQEGAWKSSENRVERHLAPGVRERLTAREGRIDWRFSIDPRLAQRGRLSIEAKVDATGRPRRDGRSWRWPVRGGRSIRVGGLRVEDARGRVVPGALLRARGDRLLVDGPPRLSRTGSPLTVELTVSAEYPASDALFLPAVDYQDVPKVAWGGGQYLVVWQEWRAADPIDVYGARVTAEGELLDPAGIPIGVRQGDQALPAVASDGGDFFVVWEDYSPEVSGIYGTRVTGDGVVLDPFPVRVSPAEVTALIPSLAWDGANYLVVWYDWRGQDDIYGARVSPDGTVLDETGIPISTAPGVQWAPVVSWSGSEFLVAWADERNRVESGSDVYGSRLTADGTVLDPAGIAISTAPAHQHQVAVASRGDNFLVVWIDERFGAQEDDVYGARVADDGTVLDAGGIPISTEPQDAYAPSVASDGTNYLVAWGDPRGNDIYGARVTGEGIVLDPDGFPISTAAQSQYSPSIGWNGSNYLVVWTDDRGGSGDIYMARVSPNGEVLDPDGILASLSANPQYVASIAWDGENYLVVWEDGRTGSYNSRDIYAARLSADGQILDGTGIPIALAPERQHDPIVAWNGTNYLVVWQDASWSPFPIKGARVTPAGQVLDPGGFGISTMSSNLPVAVAASAENSLVLWGAADGVYGARVAPSGLVLDPDGIRISPAGSAGAGAPAGAWSGTTYLAVWAARGSGQDFNVYGARVTTSGTVLDPQGVPIVTASGDQGGPSVAWGNSSYLVAWADTRGQGGVSAARIAVDGVVLDPDGFTVTAMAVEDTLPSVAWEGADFLVALESWSRWSSSNILGARVTEGGEVLDDPPYPIAATSQDEYFVTATAGASGRTALVYTRWTTERAYGYAERAFVRFFDDDSQPVPPHGDYEVSTETGQSLIPGTVDIGNHCDDCVTSVELPFPVTFYGRTYTTAEISSDGNVQFVTDSAQWLNTCPLPGFELGRSVSVLWDDLLTDQAGTGIFTAVLGSPPNQQFVIEWRTIYFGGTGHANFELVLNEADGVLRTVYGEVTGAGASSTTGVQSSDSGPVQQFACDEAGSISTGLAVTYSPISSPPPPP